MSDTRRTTRFVVICVGGSLLAVQIAHGWTIALIATLMALMGCVLGVLIVITADDQR